MNEMLERRRLAAIVQRQADEIASDAVGKIVMASMRSAQTCGCRRCRRAAGETTLWAAVILEPTATPPTEPTAA
jgi:hypothetical protein